MTRQRYRSIAMVCGAVLLAVGPGGASVLSAAPAPPANLQVEDVRSALAQIGYVVAGSVDTSDGHVRIVEAHAPAGPEIVRAIVFADMASAAAAREQAMLVGDGIAYTDDVGPQLLSGYGASAWHRNVALIQTSPDTFGLLMPPEIDCVSAGSGTPGVPFRKYTVDPDVIQAIQSL